MPIAPIAPIGFYQNLGKSQILGTRRPDFSWADDEQLAAALSLCVRKSQMSDRTSRSVPREFSEYGNAHRLQLARAIYVAMLELAEVVPGSQDSVGEANAPIGK